MIKISAFADEISPDLDEQIAVLQQESIGFIDLRSAWKVNVLDLDDVQVAEIKQRLARAGIGVACIGSPIGKVSLDVDLDDQLQRLDRAIALANTFGTRLVRIFSFYPPEGARGAAPLDWTPYRGEVIRRLRVFAERAAAAGITLLHENDLDLYGDVVARCLDVLESVDSPHLQAVFDPANLIFSGEQPYPDALNALRPWIRHMHVKDAAAGKVVAAGEGEARWPEIIAALQGDGYDGFFALEPHLAAAGRYQGFSGKERFHRAVERLSGLASSSP